MCDKFFINVVLCFFGMLSFPTQIKDLDQKFNMVKFLLRLFYFAQSILVLLLTQLMLMTRFAFELRY